MLGAAYFGVTRDRRGAWVVGLLVVSHWLLDFIVHRPDLPLLIAGGPRLGLGLWNSAGRRTGTRARVVRGVLCHVSAHARWESAGFKPWVLAAMLLAIQVANAVGPPPPSVEAIAWVGQAQWLLVAAGYWAERPARGRHEPHAGTPIAGSPLG